MLKSCHQFSELHTLASVALMPNGRDNAMTTVRTTLALSPKTSAVEATKLCQITQRGCNTCPALDRKHPRWWSGGVSAAIAQTVTAPFDLLESRMVSVKKNVGLADSVRSAVQQDGFLSLYDGLGAQVLRQLTYTTLRFHLYEWGKLRVDECSFLMKVYIASLAGCVAGVVGIPTEVVNTRMQVDRALPSDQRWNYRNVFDGLYRVAREEGIKTLYSSFMLACVRSALTTVVQNAAYDQAKEVYMYFFDFKHDNSVLHLISSVTAVCAFGPITQPIENLRTIKMVNSLSLVDSIHYMMRFGPLGPFRGMVPSMLRLVPNTIITFLLYEKLRSNFGYYEKEQKVDKGRRH